MISLPDVMCTGKVTPSYNFSQRDKGTFLISSFERTALYSWWENERAALLRVFFILTILKINLLINFILFFTNTFTSGKYFKYREFVFSKNIANSVTPQLVTLLATFCWTLAISLLFHFTSTWSRCIFWNEKRPFSNLSNISPRAYFFLRAKQPALLHPKSSGYNELSDWYKGWTKLRPACYLFGVLFVCFFLIRKFICIPEEKHGHIWSDFLVL